MMETVFYHTGNLPLLKCWMPGLRDPYDRNNGSHAEPDNLDQVLYLVSLFSDRDHPVVKTVRAEVAARLSEGHLTGFSDFNEPPVYQTRWLRVDAERLGFDFNVRIPDVPNSYAPLSWWDRREETPATSYFSGTDRRHYPYLAWAEDNFYGRPEPLDLPDTTGPLTGKAEARHGNYTGLSFAGIPTERHIAFPHTWHAAEAFQSLLGAGLR